MEAIREWAVRCFKPWVKMKHHQIFQIKWTDRKFQSNTMWTQLPSACDPRISEKSCFLMSWAATCAWSILPTCHDEKFPSVLVLLVLPNHSWNFTIKAISWRLKILFKLKPIGLVSWKYNIIHNWTSTVCQMLGDEVWGTQIHRSQDGWDKG